MGRGRPTRGGRAFPIGGERRAASFTAPADPCSSEGQGKTKALSVRHHFHCREEKTTVWAGKMRDCSHIYMTQVTVLGGERTAMKHAEPCHREKQEQDVNPPGEGQMGT